jgi:tetratricopeptide (TPR) repeat protein
MEQTTRVSLRELAALATQGKHQKVAMLCEQALQQQPGQPSLVLLLAVSYRNLRQYARAHAVLDAIPEAGQRVPEIMAERARLLMADGDVRGALALFMKVLEGRPDDLRLWWEVGYLGLGLADEALVGKLQDLVDAVSTANQPVALTTIATLQLALARTADAAATVEAARALDPERWEVLNAAASLARVQGDFEAAAEAYRGIMAQHPTRYDILAEIAAITRYEDPAHPDLTAFRDAIAREEVPSRARVRLGMAFGKALDDLGQYDEAWAVMAAANARRHRRSRPWDRAVEVARIEAAKACCPDRAEATDATTVGDGGPTPVLVVGLPRSGTSLVEQILASHPLVAGAGETALLPQHLFAEPLDLDAALSGAALASLREHYPEALRAKAGEARWICDKYPANFQLIGPFLAAFPAGRVIHCRRDLRDTAVSLMFQDFPTGNAYANDLSDIAAYAELYRGVMAHWESLEDPRLMSVDYEALIADAEPEVRRMLDHLDLDFDPACLDFHATARSVSTLSSWQVRQPLYDRAVGRWRHYAAQLAAFSERLGLED